MTTDQNDALTTFTVRPNRPRMRDARYLQGELGGVGELLDLHGRRFTPRSFRATWERQGGEEWPWELRVTVQGPSILKGGGIGEKVRSLVWEPAGGPGQEHSPATFRELPDWLAKELAPFAPDFTAQVGDQPCPGCGSDVELDWTRIVPPHDTPDGALCDAIGAKAP